MRRALPSAVRARDKQAVAALRSALAAIDNAEAVDTPQAPPGQGPGSAARAEQTPIAGAVLGLGAGEVARRKLTAAEMENIVHHEVADRRAAAHAYMDTGQSFHAEADLLSGYLHALEHRADPPPPG